MNKQKKSLSISTMLSTTLILTLSAFATYADKLIYSPKSAVAKLAAAKFSYFSESAAAKLSYSPESAPFNTKFKEWSAQWWQFMLSFPVAVNPLLDEKCVVGQRGSVWFLSGGDGFETSHTCTIPAGKSLFFPLLSLATIGDPYISADELRADIAPCLDTVTAVSVEVDDNSIIRFNKINKFRVKSEVFDVTLPEENLFSLVGDVPPGTYSPAVADGFYVMLKPLKVGDHTVHISAVMPGIKDYDACADPMSLDVTYTLTVVPVTLK